MDKQGVRKLKIIKENNELAKEIEKALKENNGYCPCRAIKNSDTKCMCKEFREQKEGLCHCGLYKKVKE